MMRCLAILACVSLTSSPLIAQESEYYRAVPKGEFYSSGFLTEGKALPFGRLLGNVTPAQITRLTASYTGWPNHLMAVEPPKGAAYRQGDSLLIVQLGEEVGQLGRAVVPTGLAVVQFMEGGQAIVMVERLYRKVLNGNLVVPAEQFRDPGSARPVPISSGVTGTVVGFAGQHAMVNMLDVLFIDRGRMDGVAVGDVFEARRTPESVPGLPARISQMMALLQVVHVGDHSATVRVIEIPSPALQAGTTVVQVAKLPS